MSNDLMQTTVDDQKIKQKKTIKRLVALIIVLALAIVLVIYVLSSNYLDTKLRKVDLDTDETYTIVDVDISQENEEDDLEFAMQPSYEEVENLEDMMLQHYERNDGILQDREIINVLLIGRDTDNSSENARSDVMIIISINNRTKELKLVSLLRDTYVYIPTKGYQKINHAHSYGGPKLLMEVVEKHFKVHIDNYMSVDFNSFPKVIDALGGVEIELTDKEIKYMKKTILSGSASNLTAGKCKLTGDQALAYSRIRKLDNSEVQRTGRQRTLLLAIVEQYGNANFFQTDKMLNELLPNIKTDFTRENLLAHGKNAETYLSYNMIQSVMPSEELRVPVEIKKNKNDKYGTFYWLCDIPACAKEMQELLYGTSNIDLTGDFGIDKIREQHEKDLM